MCSPGHALRIEDGEVAVGSALRSVGYGTAMDRFGVGLEVVAQA